MHRLLAFSSPALEPFDLADDIWISNWAVHSDLGSRRLFAGNYIRGCDQINPPLGGTIWPWIHEALSEARKRTTSAISCGSPTRLKGLSAAERLSAASSLPARKRSVSTGPGATALTRPPRPASSLDMAR